MTDKLVSTTIEILGKLYPVRCPETELKSLQHAAEYLNQRMLDVQESGKAINVERIAIMTALNITNQLLQMDQQKSSLMDKINSRISQMQNRLETAINSSLQTEMIYSSE